jgi:hypothetical protein
MMDAQGSEALLYGSLLGSSSTPQTMSGTSSTDPTSGSFSFSLNPGSTYLGQSITDSVQGQFNSMTNSYDWSAMGSSGLGVSWLAQGNLMPIEIDPAGPKWKITSFEKVFTLLSNPPKFIYKATDTITIFGGADGKPALSIKDSKFNDPFGGPFGGAGGFDIYDPKTGMFEFQDLFKPNGGIRPLAFQETSSGTTPFAGGAGTYTTTINSVPEPSSLLMALIGIGTVFGTACRTVAANQAARGAASR